MAGNGSKLEIKRKRGRPRSHGAYSLIVHGKLPQHRIYLRRYLSLARDGIVCDLGGEENMSMAQLILADRAISKLAICRVVEEHVKETSVIEGSEITPVLKKSYLSFCNSLRLDLLALKDLGKDQVEPTSTIAQIIAEFDASKENEKSQKSTTDGRKR